MLRNKSQKELLQLSKRVVQPLLPHFHKGQAGRIAVIGGCEDYTGAPFFASHSAALLGCDLSHIICERNAAQVIKSYSPDLMVHPYLYDSNSRDKNDGLNDEEFIDDKILPKVVSVLSRMHLVVIGPGFGRDPLMIQTLTRLIEEVKVLNIPLILDADALYVLSKDPKIISNYQKAVLTPNVIEFKRLANAVGEEVDSNANLDESIELTVKLSKLLGGVTIVRKGAQEIIAQNDHFVVNEMPGSNRRVGGQGDTLAGAMATFLTWSSNYQAGVWGKPDLNQEDSNLLACFAAASTVRLASSKAFKKYGRAMQTSNVHEYLGETFSELFPESIDEIH
ncbi:ATP-dependent (S)-NAD(P)H-hydrate dehydratase [[Candida] anglica]|uniref:ATP-dependent (S)-NAD(P)H-hydrate dehydratase n=1 Tax=[Candida] anglica TaxID=148631 RepID=A0ABP0ECB1_9ASCO